MNKKQTVELLKQQLPGFYSLEQVIGIINGIEEGRSFNPEELIEKISRKVETALLRMDTEDLVDTGSAEFELHGNEINLERVDVNVEDILEEVREVITEVVTDYFPAPSEE
jgi:hypothetical protein